MSSTMNKQNLEGMTYAPSISNSARRKKQALVIGVNEWENICDVIYPNTNSKVQKLNNIAVRITDPDSNWFPTIGDFVYAEDGNDNCPEIIGPAIDDYVATVRQKRMSWFDIMSYGLSMRSGGGYC